jgi:hypothetical protein
VALNTKNQIKKIKSNLMETKYVMDGHIDKRKTYCWPTPANGGIKNTLHDKILE